MSLCSILVVAMALIAPGTPTRRVHGPMIVHERHATYVKSGNWSGYAVEAPRLTVTKVQGSWIVLAVKCAPGETSYSSFWIGIDGSNNNTVEQIGTDSDCIKGVATYFVWYEFYPHPYYIVNSIKIAPGNTVSAVVAADAKSGKITLTLAKNQDPAFSITVKAPAARLESAEWIAEAPSGSSILPLANFSVAQFGADNTLVANTNYATIGGASLPIKGWDKSPYSLYKIDMASGSLLKTQTSELTPVGTKGANGTSFTVGFVAPGP